MQMKDYTGDTSYADKVRKRIKEISWFEDDDIVSINTKDANGKLISINRRDISLTKALNLIEAGWTALPF